MDSKVVSTLALLVGVLVALYILTGDRDKVAAEETETVSIQETSELPPMSEEETEEVTEMRHSEMEMEMGSQENLSEEEVIPENVEESPEADENVEENSEEEEEVRLQPNQYNVSGYGGDDYSTF